MNRLTGSHLLGPKWAGKAHFGSKRPFSKEKILIADLWVDFNSLFSLTEIVHQKVLTPKLYK